MSATTDFTASVGIVVEMIKSLRAKGVNGQELLVEINNKLHDETLFNKAQRPNVLKSVNKALGTKYSLSQIKRAVQSTPQAAVRVDELHGSTNLETQTKTQQEGTNMSVQEKPEVSAIDLAAVEASKEAIVVAMIAAGYVTPELRAALSDAFAESIPVAGKEIAKKIEEVGGEDPDLVLGHLCMDPFFNMVFARFVSENKKEAPAAEEPVVEDATAERKRNIDTFSSKPAQPAAAPQQPAASKPELTQEKPTMTQPQATVRSITPNADRIREVHGEKREEGQPLTAAQLDDILAQAGVTTAGHVAELSIRFFAAHPLLKTDYDAIVNANQSADTKAHLAAWVGASVGNSVAFMLYVKGLMTGEQQQTQVAEAPTTFGEKVMTTLRGNRKEGFSSGVVAAAAAVVGGGIEMAVRGDISVGSAVGTALGATAGYFAANAAEGLMESETGRYLLSGSIGLVAGGLGSRGGSMAQSAFQASAQEMEDTIKQIPEAHRPQGTLAAPVITGSLFR